MATATPVNSVRRKQAPVSNHPGMGGGALFSMLDKAIRLDSVFEQGVPLKHVPRVLFLFMLAIVYIANSHFSNKLTRRLNKTQAEVEELRVDYTTTKAAYMEAGKQSKVAANVADMGLEESSVPPRKIKLNDEE